jgi:hypothetical protein
MQAGVFNGRGGSSIHHQPTGIEAVEGPWRTATIGGKAEASTEGKNP